MSPLKICVPYFILVNTVAVICSDLPCSWTSEDEIDFEKTPIGKTFNRTQNRPECIVACTKYPACISRRQNGTKTDKIKTAEEQAYCDEFIGTQPTQYMKGPGWNIAENRKRIMGASTCPNLPIKVQGIEVKNCEGRFCVTMRTDCFCSKVYKDQSCSFLDPTIPQSFAQIKNENPNS